MSLEQTTELYASVLRQLLPEGVYDTAGMTHVADDIYAHAKALAQADIDAHRLLQVLETIPVDLLVDYEREYGLPMQCMVPGSQTIEERINVLRWIRQHRNVMNSEYLEQILAIFGVVLLELKKYKPMQCIGTCVDPVNTEELRYKVRLVIPSDAPADLGCIIENYLPGYLRVDVLRTPLSFKTSKTYPTLFDERIRSTASIIDVAQRTVMNNAELETENLSSSASLLEVSWRDVMNSAKIEIESTVTLASITEVVRRSIMNSTSTTTESVGASALITGVTRKVALLTNTASIDSMMASASIVSAQITN